MPELKLTKFVHSCLLVEYDGQVILFDPGNFSWESGLFDASQLANLDAIVITHEHADHFHPPFVTHILEKFPDVQCVTTPPVAEQLSGLGVKNVSTTGTDKLQLFTSKHENLLFNEPGPTNTGVHFADILTHPGDSHSFQETKAVLAMPMTAPWGSMVRASNKITELKPKVVIPIHDWHWRPEALEKFYERLKEQLAAQNIDFIIPTDGQAVTINL